jgi:lipoprotein-releasing system ATP-binding protein
MSSLLRVRDLHKSFSEGGSEIRVLQGVDFELAEGERLAVIGESGVGKSTLLHIIGTLDRPSGGEIFYRAEGFAP